jgi:antirestriction protein ArdC
MIKKFNVFNVEQTTGLPAEYYELPEQEPMTEFEKDERAEDLLKRATDKMGVQLTIKESNRAYYSRHKDEIVLPLREQFNGVSSRFYSVANHELIHSSAPRLDRSLEGAFGSPEYAKEELIAELGAAFNCSALGVELDITDNVAYLQSWLSVLKADSKAIVSAAANHLCKELNSPRCTKSVQRGFEYRKFIYERLFLFTVRHKMRCQLGMLSLV